MNGKGDIKTGMKALDLVELVSYNPRTGKLTRRDGTELVPKTYSDNKTLVAICGYQAPATTVIYALLHGEWPLSVRTVFVDGHSSNLARSNLRFSESTRVRVGGSNMGICDAIVKILTSLGKPSTLAQVNAVAGLQVSLSSYMSSLERAARVHAVGVDRTDTRLPTVWAIGPRPLGQAEFDAASARASSRKRVSVAKDKIKVMLKSDADKVVEKAMSGRIANSVFSMGYLR